MDSVSARGLLGLLLMLFLATAALTDQRLTLQVEKEPRFIPAGRGQKPFDVTRHLISLDEIRGGGPPRDGIPALDNPLFLTAPEADRVLKPADVLIGLAFDGVAKAYPIRILNWHELVNDTVGARPVLVTW
jgi:hypothetical protein